jgi:hypothetical protein
MSTGTITNTTTVSTEDLWAALDALDSIPEACSDRVVQEA